MGGGVEMGGEWWATAAKVFDYSWWSSDVITERRHREMSASATGISLSSCVPVSWSPGVLVSLASPILIFVTGIRVP